MTAWPNYRPGVDAGTALQSRIVRHRPGTTQAGVGRERDNTMTNAEWKSCMVSLIEGVKLELGPAVPTRTKVALATFRERLERKLITPLHKSFERELEVFLQGSPALRTAAQRYIRKTAPPLIREAEAALTQARDLLAQAPNHEGGANGRQPFRSSRIRKSGVAASRRSL